MYRTILTLMALAGAAAASAQETATVLSSTPVIGQVAVPQQVCQDSTVVVPGRHDGTGAAVGAIAGAVVGGAATQGHGRVVGSVIGMVGGAMIGERLAGRGPDQLQQVRHCTTTTTYHNQVLHYDVVYEYAGRRHAVQLPHDPGPTLQVQVTPVGMPPPAHPAPHPQAMADMAPMRVAPSITTIRTATEFVPWVSYATPVHTVVPIIIGLPAPRWRHAPHRPHHPGRHHHHAHPRHGAPAPHGR